jgi:ADP-ribosylglycohydrolase
MFGLALGDALGAPTEFMTVDEIVRHYPPDGPKEPKGNPARVTDDTQMALAVGEALMAAERPLTVETLEGPLRTAFVEWLRSPENNRAPGRTCLAACANLERGMPWVQATLMSSKGCGANMRVAPVGFLSQEHDGVDAKSRSAIAQFQAALTHGHPTALAAADLTVAAIADLASGGDPAGLPVRLRAYALSQREVYHEEWLGALWQRPGLGAPGEFIARGWDECLSVLDKLEWAVEAQVYDADPCLSTGAGWVAEEALVTGLLCFLLYPEEPVKALRRAAVTSGDSDSIACLAGAFAGAHLGMESWPTSWVERIEYRARLAAIGSFWDG